MDLLEKTEDPNLLLTQFETFYIPRRLRGKKDNTKGKFRYAIAHFATFLERPPTLNDLEDDLIEEFLDWMAETGLARHTANSYGSKIRALWQLLAMKGRVKTFPDIRRLKVPKKKPVGWTRQEIQAIGQSASEQPGMVAGVPARWFWLGLLAVIWDTAERISAVLNLRPEYLNRETRILTIPAEIRKGQTEDMVHRLRPDTMFIISQIMAMDPGREFIFVWDLDRSSLWNHLKRIVKRAGLPTDRTRMFHCIRKTTASFLKASGGDAQGFLGHAQAQTTQDSYMVPEIVQGQFASDMLFDPFPLKTMMQ